MGVLGETILEGKVIGIVKMQRTEDGYKLTGKLSIR